MRRRDFIVLLSSAAMTWPGGSRAQKSDRIRRIGLLMIIAETESEAQADLRAFKQGLRTLGWVEGENIKVDYRWTAGDPDRLRADADSSLI
jgi:putative ABC transport system substrate-binding protein